MTKTIVEKLNLNKFDKKLVLNRPDDTYLSDLDTFDQEATQAEYDLTFVFVTNKVQFVQFFEENKDKIAQNGIYAVAYPKKGNKKFAAYVHRDELFDLLGADSETGIIGESTLKFNRMVALDDIYTVVAIKNIGKTEVKTRPSARVADYAAKISDIKELLQGNVAALTFYENLTAGYQKDWARYIFSAKTAPTQEKRRAEMLAAFQAGYKTADLYKKSLK